MLTPASPYELSAAADLVDRLHPRLRAYFAAIPPGHVGRGAGVFAVVGTPRRWLWPVLALFALDGVMFPVWERDVPFRVENRPAVDRAGHVAVTARRTFSFRTGARTMTDAITAEPEGLVDHLGRHGSVCAALRIDVVDGGLRLVSTRVWFAVRSVRVGLPSILAPRVVLRERFDDDADVQRVSLTLTAPIIGTIYRYEGSFTYAILPEDDEGTP